MLVYWPEEDCISVVAGSYVSGNQQAGSTCTVSMQKTYSGQIAATGKQCF